jgi:hypothetical protein
MNDHLHQQCDSNDLKDMSNKMCHSIVNSVTNDEEDWLERQKNSGHSIVNSVTYDEDEDEGEWIGHRNSGRGAVVSIQHRPSNYRSAFSTQETAIKGPKQTDSIVEPNPSLPMFKRERSAKNCFGEESFLNRYERMMIEQEKEQDCTISHLQFFFELLTELQLDGQNGLHRHQMAGGNNSDFLLTEFSVEDLKQAQKKLNTSEKYDVAKSDKQLLMVLDILCKDEEKYAETQNLEEKRKKISGAEIVQCYRNCVVGMQTLEMIGSHGTIRRRTKERTIALLSAYSKYSFLNYSPSVKMSSGRHDSMKSTKTYDRGFAHSSRVDRGSHQDTKLRRLLRNPLMSFFAGVMLAAILLFESSYIQGSTTEHYSRESAREIQGAKCPVVVNDYILSDFEVCEEIKGDYSQEKSVSHTMNEARDQVHTETTETGNHEPNRSTRKSPITTEEHTVPSMVKARINDNASITPLSSSKALVFDPKLNNEKKRLSSFETKVANVFGGTATILYLLSSSTRSTATILAWSPTGLKVMIAVFAAQGFRNWLSNVWRNLKRDRKNLNVVST